MAYLFSAISYMSIFKWLERTSKLINSNKLGIYFFFKKKRQNTGDAKMNFQVSHQINCFFFLMCKIYTLSILS